MLNVLYVHDTIVYGTKLYTWGNGIPLHGGMFCGHGTVCVCLHMHLHIECIVVPG